MAALKALLRLIAFVYHVLLTLFLIAVSGIALASGAPTVQLQMLPWTGTTLLYVVLFGGLFGLATAILAILGRLRFLFFLWSLAVMLLLIKGYIFSRYRFAPAEPMRAMYLIIGSVIAAFGAWFQMRRTTYTKPRY